VIAFSWLVPWRTARSDVSRLGDLSIETHTLTDDDIYAGNTIRLPLLNFQSQLTTQDNPLFATILLVTIPRLIMFIIFNRKIVEGMAAGPVKG